MMKNNILHITLFSVVMVLLFMPLAQKEFNFFKIKKLSGVTTTTEKPSLTLDNYKINKYQTELEKYVSENFGFREPTIRLYNQYLWDFYRKTYCKNVVVGKDDWLFNERSVKDHYVGLDSDYVKGDEDIKVRFDKEVARLKRVQEMLKKHGTYLFVLILPAKDVIYPELLPENKIYFEEKGLRAIDYYPQAFAANGIDFLNVAEIFKNIKDSVDYQLFPKFGMHWSNIACAHVSDSIIRYMEHLSGKNFPNIHVGEKYNSEPRIPDNDMEELLNLSRKINRNSNFYADVTVIPDSTAVKPNLIVNGDSFFWNMTYTLPMDEIFNYHHYWYYFSKVYFDEKYKNTKEFDLLEQLYDADIVMISLSATQLYDINHGLISQAFIKLSLDDQETYNRCINGIKERMRDDAKWLESLNEKAIKRHLTLDEVMTQDAIYVINQDPEKYIK